MRTHTPAPLASQKLEIRNRTNTRTPEPRHYLIMMLPCRCRPACSGEICFGSRTRSLIFPALLHRLPHALRVLLPVVFVQVGRFDVGRRAGIRVVQETAQLSACCNYKRRVLRSILTFGCWLRPLQHHTSGSIGSAECPGRVHQ